MITDRLIEKIKEEIISINSNSESGYWNVGKIETRGKYTLTLQGYTGETIEEEGNGIFIIPHYVVYDYTITNNTIKFEIIDIDYVRY